MLRLCGLRRCSRMGSPSEKMDAWISAVKRGEHANVLEHLNAIKAASASSSLTDEGIDYVRALCFLESPQSNPLEARQALLEELRMHPGSTLARTLLYELNERVRPFLRPPTDVVQQEPLFAMLHEALMDYTMLSWPRLLALFRRVQHMAASSRTCGHVVECGTAGGGSAVLMAVALADLNRGEGPPPLVFALDTFRGMPPPTSADAFHHTNVAAEASNWSSGTCRGSSHHVHRLAEHFGVGANVMTIEGRVENTLASQLLKDERLRERRVGVLHVDVDWYEPTKHILASMLPVMMEAHARTGQACYVQVDDYHYWSGCQRAVKEVVSAHSGTDGRCFALHDVDEHNAVWFEV